MIIGLTGLNGSGKGTIAKYLKEKGFVYYSLSDEIRLYLEKAGIKINRNNLIKAGNDLRKRYGPDILANKIVERIKNNQRKIIIDSIRNPAEVEVLKNFKDFYLLSVEALISKRFKRVSSRNRENDPKTLKEMVELEKVDGKSKNFLGQQVVKCQKLADIHILNDGSIEDIGWKVYHVLSEIRRRESKRNRLNVDDYFLKICTVVAERSTCTRRHVGAIAVKNNHILATGYNGAPIGTEDSLDLGCLRDKLRIPSGTKHEICRSVHAEQNVIIQSALHGANLEGATIYCTHTPCILCAKMLVNARIKRFVTFSSYADKSFINLFKEARIKLDKISKPSIKINVLE